jgi:hypothetical protein
MSTSKLTLAQRRKLMKINENVRQQLNEAIDKEQFAKFKKLFGDIKQITNLLRSNGQTTFANQLTTTLNDIKAKFANYKQVDKKNTLDKVTGFLGRVTKGIFSDEDGDFKLLSQEFEKCTRFYSLVAQKVEAADITESFDLQLRSLLSEADDNDPDNNVIKKPKPPQPNKVKDPNVADLDHARLGDLQKRDQQERERSMATPPGSSTLQSVIMTAAKQVGLNVNVDIAKEIAQLVRSGNLPKLAQQMDEVGKEIKEFGSEVAQSSDQQTTPTEDSQNDQTPSNAQTNQGEQAASEQNVKKAQVVDWVKKNVTDNNTRTRILNVLKTIPESYNHVLKVLLSN